MLLSDPLLERMTDGDTVELAGGSVEILLAPAHVEISIPYAPADYDQLARRIAAHVKTLKEVAGYVVYDPQAEQLIDHEAGPRELLPGLTPRPGG